MYAWGLEEESGGYKAMDQGKGRQIWVSFLKKFMPEFLKIANWGTLSEGGNIRQGHRETDHGMLTWLGIGMAKA